MRKGYGSPPHPQSDQDFAAAWTLLGCADLVQLANFAFSVAGYTEEVLSQLDCVLFRRSLQNSETADQFLGLGEGAIGHGYFAVRLPHASSHRTGQTSLSSNEVAGLHPFFDEFAHFGHFLRCRRRILFGGLVNT